MASGKIAGNAKILLTLDDKVKEGLRSVQNKLNGVGKTLTGIGTTAAAAGASILAPLAGAATAFTQIGSELQELSVKTGLSASYLSELSYAAIESGTDMNTLARAFRNMQKNGLDPMEFDRVAAEIMAIQDPTERAAKAMEYFGKTTGPALLPLMADLPKLREEARALGVTMTDESAAAADVLGDAMDKVTEQFKFAAVNIGAAVAGPMTQFAEWVSQHLASLIEWTKQNAAIVTWIAKIGATLAVTGTAVFGLGKAFTAAALGAGGLNTALTFLVAHPVVAGLAAITAGVVAMVAAVRNANDAWNSFDESLQKSEFKQTMRSADELNQMIKRFEQLADKAELTKEETSEAFNLVHALRTEYGNLASPSMQNGKLANTDKFMAQLNAARGGRSQHVLSDRLSAAESSLDVARSKGADAPEIAKRVEQVAKLREELDRYNRVVADATPTATPAATTAIPTEPAAAKESGEKAGAAFGKAFADFMRTKIEGVGDMITETLGDGSEWITNMGETIKQKLIEAQNALPEDRLQMGQPQQGWLDVSLIGQQITSPDEEIAILKSIDKNTKKLAVGAILGD
jgi:hypothetical protein